MMSNAPITLSATSSLLPQLMEIRSFNNKISKYKNYLDNNITIPCKLNRNDKYLEYRTMPIFLGWYQKGNENQKNNWLKGKCEEWLNATGAKKRLRDDVAPDFQCPCTLDHARANPGFWETDSLCTSTFCKYNNYDAADCSHCLSRKLHSQMHLINKYMSILKKKF